MGSLHHMVYCHLGAGLVTHDPKSFTRPIQLSAGDVPPEAARMTEPLRFREVSFASSQGLLGAAPFNSLFSFAQRPQYRGHNAREAGLEDVIGRADLQAFD